MTVSFIFTQPPQTLFRGFQLDFNSLIHVELGKTVCPVFLNQFIDQPRLFSSNSALHFVAIG